MQLNAIAKKQVCLLILLGVFNTANASNHDLASITQMCVGYSNNFEDQLKNRMYNICMTQNGIIEPDNFGKYYTFFDFY